MALMIPDDSQNDREGEKTNDAIAAGSQLSEPGTLDLCPQSPAMVTRLVHTGSDSDGDEPAHSTHAHGGPAPSAETIPAVPIRSPHQLPATFGRYRLLEKLGKGGMALVYLAHDAQLDRRVALKVPLFFDADDERIARFTREARTAANLHHPNICPVFDVGSIDGVQFLTMAYIEGETLAAYLKRTGPLRVEEAAGLLCKLADALQEAHDAGIIHRDLKPSNVMIDKRGEPIVMDFGVARRAGDDAGLTRSGAPLGTPAYMPPEQVTGDCRSHGPASDIYSLGVIMYELLLGALPFTGDLASVASKILQTPPPALRTRRPELSPALEAVCLKALAKAPEDRYPSARAFAEALAAAVRGGAAAVPREASAASASMALRRGISRSRLLVGAAAAALALLLLTRLAPRSDPADGVVSERAALDAPSAPPEPLSVAEPLGPAVHSPAPPTLEIFVQRARQSADYHVLSAMQTPLRDGDKVQLKVAVDAPAYLYLFWFDAEGRAKRLQPTDPVHQNKRREWLDPPTEPNEQALENWHVIGGVHGVEMALAAVADEPLSSEQLQDLDSVRVVFIERGPGALIEMAAAERGLVAQEKSRKGRLFDVPAETLVPVLLPHRATTSLVRIDHAQAEDLEFGRGLIGRMKTVKGRRIAGVELRQYLRTCGIERFTAWVFPHN